MVTVKRALLSCYDKTGLDEFAKELAALGIELVASGGTAEFLTQHGLRVTSVETFAGIAEQLDGRVKTLHPKIHAGILARRDDPAHVQAVGARGLIDLVVVSLYPFERTIQRPDVSLDEAIEQIDVGGVALLRAAAKNFAYVAVASRPEQYRRIAEALRRGAGQLPPELSRQLSVSAFQLTSAYDTWIAGFLGADACGEQAEDTVSWTLRRRQELRYGENPHQSGAWYVPAEEPAWGLGTLSQLQGKPLSYNNLLDMDAALRCLLDFAEPACAIIKHNSLCGLASASTVDQAFAAAYEGDAESAFGGIVGFNRPVEVSLTERLVSVFLEVILAPSVAPQAMERFQRKPNLRIVTLQWPQAVSQAREWRQLSGGWLAQSPDSMTLDEGTLKVVTKRAPSAREEDGLRFAWSAAKHVKSNGIVIVAGRATLGIGQGQPSRVGSVRLAIQKAGQRARSGVAASDGFFPFPDSVELLAKAGVSAIIQPGGSVKDPEVIQAADQANLAMLFTGVRHFRH